MGTYTVSVQELLDSEFDFGLKPENYKIFDETYRAGLNKKILDHYRNYEIGFETEDMWHFALNRRMREIMPYYNNLYESEKIEFDPLQTIDLSDVSDTETESVNTNGSKSRARSVGSELPQVRLSPDEDYGTAMSDASSDTSATGEGTSTGNVTHKVTGSQGHAPMLLMQYRASLLNIDLMVISDLSQLFMGLWETNDSHINNGRYYGYGFGYRLI